MKFVGLGHINIVVDNLDSAVGYYSSLLKAKPIQSLPHFKNVGFARSVGFTQKPSNVDVSMVLMDVNDSGIQLKLMEFHCPQGRDLNLEKRTNDIGGVGHICIKVEDIDECFEHVRTHAQTRFITDSENYRPFQLTPINNKECYFFKEELEQNSKAKQMACEQVESAKSFYFVDRYGIQWEFEQECCSEVH